MEGRQGRSSFIRTSGQGRADNRIASPIDGKVSRVAVSPFSDLATAIPSMLDSFKLVTHRLFINAMLLRRDVEIILRLNNRIDVRFIFVRRNDYRDDFFLYR